MFTQGRFFLRNKGISRFDAVMPITRDTPQKSGDKRVQLNNVRKIREALMMSKAELARKAGLSTLTVDRVEAGKACRLDTKRKLLQALGLKVSDRESVFGLTDDDNPTEAARTAQASDTLEGR